jgi:magnesium transporter
MKSTGDKSKRKKKSKFKIGLAPGALVFTGDKKIDSGSISILSYDEEDFFEEKTTLEDLPNILKTKRKVLWIDIDGLHEVALLEKIGALFGIHRLTLEDILNVNQRPKMEVFDDYIFAVLKMIQCPTPESDIEEEQISFILKDNILITFQEKKGDLFTYVRERIVEFKGNIRKRGGDYLLYALLDAVIDNYFLVLENVGEKIDVLEASAMNNPNNLSSINNLYKRKENFD